MLSSAFYMQDNYHTYVPFIPSEKTFDNEHKVINWIIDNQLFRRNITDDQKAYLIGKRYKEEKKPGSKKEMVKFW